MVLGILEGMKESEKESENETKGGKSDEEKPKLRTELMRM
jgi:hypothetical protein